MKRGGARGGRGGRGGMRGGAKVAVEPHRHAGVFIARGKEDALVTKNLVPGEIQSLRSAEAAARNVAGRHQIQALLAGCLSAPVSCMWSRLRSLHRGQRVWGEAHQCGGGERGREG